MSHGITKKDSGMVVRDPAWHGLFPVLARRPRSIEDALKKSGLHWTVEGKAIRLDGSRNGTIEGWQALQRKDTKDVLHVVTTSYQIVQNNEAFEFLAALLGSDLLFETAGSLWGGKKVFVVCSLADAKHVEVGGDRVTPYVFFGNQHGGGAIDVLTTPIRAVCQNTWDYAIEQAINRLKIAHIGDPMQKLHEARSALQLSIDYSAQFKKWGDRLARQKIAERKVLKIAEELWPGEGTDRSQKSAQRRREAVVHLFLEGDTVGSAPGTKWCAANAFVEQIEWGAKVRTDHGRLIRHITDPEGLKGKAIELVVAA